MAAPGKALNMLRRLAILIAFSSVSSGLAQAHIGSPDIYLDGKAGPYQLFVTIRPPTVIPGVAELEVRSSSNAITGVRAVPLPISGPGAKFAPVPDKLIASPQDAQLFTGSLWMMAPGSWQVRISIDGSLGSGAISIPVPSAALLTKRMHIGLGAVLSILGLFLVGGAVAIVGASVRESRLEPGVAPPANRVRAGRAAMMIALVIVACAVWFGNHWWNDEARSYAEQVYKPLRMTAKWSPSSQELRLNLADQGSLQNRNWRSLFSRSVDDFIPDHGHLMHLYAIRDPGLDVVYHLHPEQAGPGLFHLKLPSMPAGSYRLYADVVHANGFPETLVSSLQLSSPLIGRALRGDDATGKSRTWAAGENSNEFALPDGYRMLWVRPNGELHAKQPMLFRFRLEKPDGAAPADMALYMGMLGHAAFVKTDGSVFAHVHPTGSVSMAAFMLAQNQNTNPGMEGMDLPGLATPPESSLPNEVSFPYGFPSAGHYRIFVQMKHGETVETGIFDTVVR